MTKARTGEAWQGNWPERLTSELNRRGIASLRAFAESVATTTYTDIAAALEGPFAPIQMMMAIRKEFHDRGDAKGFVADCLYRYLTEYVRASVVERESREVQAAQAIGACGAAIGSGNSASILEVWHGLKDRVLEGWLPGSPDDALLVDALKSHLWRIGS
jgi:hypothetical protein